MIEYRPIRSVFFRKTEFDIVIVSTFLRVNLLPDARLNRILLLRMNQIPESLIRICKKLIKILTSRKFYQLLIRKLDAVIRFIRNVYQKCPRQIS